MNNTTIREAFDTATTTFLAEAEKAMIAAGQAAVEKYKCDQRVEVGKYVYAVYCPDRKGLVVNEAVSTKYPALREFTIKWEPCLTHPKGRYRKGIQGKQLSCYLAVDFSRQTLVASPVPA